MKKEDYLKAQLEFASNFDDIDIKSIESANNLFTIVNELNNKLAILREKISGHPEGRFSILRALFLHSEETMRPAELAEISNLTRASTSHNLDILQKNGLILRQLDLKNRRSIKVKLTREGRDLMSGIIPDYLKTVEKISKSIDLSLIIETSNNIKLLNEKIESIISKYNN